jgi:hypothetical protein
MTMFYIRVPESTKEALSTVEPDKIRAGLAEIGERYGRSSDDKPVADVPNVPGSGERQEVHLSASLAERP